MTYLTESESRFVQENTRQILFPLIEISKQDLFDIYSYVDISYVSCFETRHYALRNFNFESKITIRAPELFPEIVPWCQIGINLDVDADDQDHQSKAVGES